MSTSRKRKTVKPYTAADMKAVSNNPEWTKKDFAKAKPFSEVFPELSATIRRRGLQKAPTKKAVSIRLSPDVLAHYRATGAGWQSRIDETLRRAARLKT